VIEKIVSLLKNKEYEMMTDLCAIMKLQGSDKGFGRHNYTTFYHSLLKEHRDSEINFFEIGIGSINPRVSSNMSYMGGDYAPGASLRGWKQYFSKAQIYGADVDRGCLFQEDRLKTFYCDQLDKQTFNDLWILPDLKDVKFDVFIEDGLHTVQANLNAIEWSFHKVKSGGYYIIEDVLWANRKNYDSLLLNMQSLGHITAMFEIPCSNNNSDNALVVIKKA